MIYAEAEFDKELRFIKKCFQDRTSQLDKIDGQLFDRDDPDSIEERIYERYPFTLKKEVKK